MASAPQHLQPPQQPQPPVGQSEAVDRDELVRRIPRAAIVEVDTWVSAFDAWWRGERGARDDDDDDAATADAPRLAEFCRGWRAVRSCVLDEPLSAATQQDAATAALRALMTEAQRLRWVLFRGCIWEASRFDALCGSVALVTDDPARLARDVLNRVVDADSTGCADAGHAARTVVRHRALLQHVVAAFVGQLPRASLDMALFVTHATQQCVQLDPRGHARARAFITPTPSEAVKTFRVARCVWHSGQWRVGRSGDGGGSASDDAPASSSLVQRFVATLVLPPALRSDNWCPVFVLHHVDAAAAVAALLTTLCGRAALQGGAEDAPDEPADTCAFVRVVECGSDGQLAARDVALVQAAVAARRVAVVVSGAPPMVPAALLTDAALRLRTVVLPLAAITAHVFVGDEGALVGAACAAVAAYWCDAEQSSRDAFTPAVAPCDVASRPHVHRATATAACFLAEMLQCRSVLRLAPGATAPWPAVVAAVGAYAASRSGVVEGSGLARAAPPTLTASDWRKAIALLQWDDSAVVPIVMDNVVHHAALHGA